MVFAKLDRLTRDLDLLRALVRSEADLIFCDLSHVPPGAMGRFLLTQMASVDQNVFAMRFGRPEGFELAILPPLIFASLLTSLLPTTSTQVRRKVAIRE